MDETRHKGINFLRKQSIHCGSLELSLQKPVVMGIINLTPDSFFDGGSYSSVSEILGKADRILKEEGQIIDIGAISTRPGALILSETEEIDRLLGPLKAIRKAFPDTIISVDTFRKEVASMAIAEGTNIINDISGGNLDDEMIPFMYTQRAAYVLMHMQGTPENMQDNPKYDNVVEEVDQFFIHHIEKFKQVGKENIILDPGFGFGKNLDHNFQLLQGLSQFSSHQYPLLVGVSRKSMINKVLKTSPATALNGTTVINTIALLNGANILRVHDVRPAVEAVKLVNQFIESNPNE